MNIIKHIPNTITCGNLYCGVMGIIYAFDGEMKMAAFMIFAAAILDFFDGFVARLLKVSSPIGKELDSLADVISFGLLPGIIVFQLMNFGQHHTFFIGNFTWYMYVALLIPVFSALRLAKFNIDTRQSDSFIGVPTPANAILIAALPLMLTENTKLLFEPNNPLNEIILNPFALAGLSITMSLLLVSEIPLFALKFKDFSWDNNKVRFIFLGISAILLVLLKFSAIPIIVFLYITLSLLTKKAKTASSI